MSSDHGGDTRQESSPELAPEAAGILEKLEAYAQTLDPREAMALRRLVQAGLLADEATIEKVTSDTAGYYYPGYYYLAPFHVPPPTLYIQPAVYTVPVAQTHYAGVRVYQPWWCR